MSKVVIADNDASFFEDYKKKLIDPLEQTGYIVIPAHNQEQASSYKDEKGVGAVISDLRLEDDYDLKDKTGLSVLKQYPPRVVRIILTSHPKSLVAMEVQDPKSVMPIYVLNKKDLDPEQIISIIAAHSPPSWTVRNSALVALVLLLLFFSLFFLALASSSVVLLVIAGVLGVFAISFIVVTMVCRKRNVL